MLNLWFLAPYEFEFDNRPLWASLATVEKVLIHNLVNLDVERLSYDLL